MTTFNIGDDVVIRPEMLGGDTRWKNLRKFLSLPVDRMTVVRVRDASLAEEVKNVSCIGHPQLVKVWRPDGVVREYSGAYLTHVN